MGKCRIIFAGLLSGIILAMSSASLSAADAAVKPPAASFAEFDRKAKAGENLSVVFFGGSLTWGANASDPLKTSFRGLMGKYLTEKYPKAHFSFHDAAIGGTGSDLGLFRLERDVLSKKPDLVFLDFTVNDGYDQKDVE
ncbi:MAG: SGNH/GDSL hydrolase family protein, partial [Victivallales bacterium]